MECGDALSSSHFDEPSNIEANGEPVMCGSKLSPS